MTLQDKVNRLTTIGITWMGPDERYQLSDGLFYNLPDIDPMDDGQFDEFVQQMIPRVPTLIDKSMTVIRNGSAILKKAELRRQKAEVLGEKILASWNEAYAIENPEKKFEALAAVDQRSNGYLVNCRTAVGEMKEERSPITQLFDKIKTLYTAEENALDNKEGKIPKQIQVFRNKYVQDLAAEQKRKEAEAAKKARRKQQEIDLRSTIKTGLGRCLITYQTNMKTAWWAGFNGITLDNYEQKKAGIEGLKGTFPSAKVQEICKDALYTGANCPDLTSAEIQEIQDNEWETYDFHSFFIKYGQEMQELKQELLDKLPSKKAELDEAERLRLEKIELDRKAKAEKDEKEKERLRQEQLRLQQQQQQQEEERQIREQQQQQDLQAQQQQSMQAVTESVEVNRASAHAGTLFEQAQEMTAVIDTPQTKSGFEIEIINKSGWIEIITFWLNRCGKDLTLDKWPKKTLDSMKKDVEAIALAADKAGKVDQIESQNLTYKPTYTAVNKTVKERK